GPGCASGRLLPPLRAFCGWLLCGTLARSLFTQLVGAACQLIGSFLMFAQGNAFLSFGLPRLTSQVGEPLQLGGIRISDLVVFGAFETMLEIFQAGQVAVARLLGLGDSIGEPLRFGTRGLGR